LNGTYIKKPKNIVTVDRIKRLSTAILNEYQDKFDTDFSNNKKHLNEISIIRSKSLKNKIAGYITKILQRQQKFEERKQQIIDSEKEESARNNSKAKMSEPPQEPVPEPPQEPVPEPPQEPVPEVTSESNSEEKTTAEEIISDIDSDKSS